MPRKLHAPLPEALAYLQPFVRSLSRLPPEDLNEDVDASRLEAALRQRVRGMGEDAARATLELDRARLQDWLTVEGGADHPAHWALGYLLGQGLWGHPTRPPQPPPRGPAIGFDPPPGWKVKVVPFRLDLKKGKVIGTIQAVDATTWENFRANYDAPARPNPMQPPGYEEKREPGDVTFGPCVGRKYLMVWSTQAAGAWKRVDYLLTVPGGHVFVFLGTATSAAFDETELESRLHTITLSAPA